MRASPGDNRFVEKNLPIAGAATSNAHGPFVPGALVILTLHNPREKFWGMILALTPEGFSLSGADLASFEDIAAMVKEGEPFTPAVVFFPMHRVERVDLDVSDGNLSSLAHRFHAKTGLDPATALLPSGNGQAGRDALESLRSHASKERA
jgi:hypothetical protein